MLLILFYIGWLFISISFFFKHTKTLNWIGHFILFSFAVYYIKENKEIFRKTFFYLTILLLLFLVFLFWFVLVSPYKMASLEAFLLNYFFHISLFFLFLILAYRNNNEKLLPPFFWLIFGLIGFISILMFYFLVLLKCNISLLCAISSFPIIYESSLIKGLVVTSSPFVLGFLIFWGYFLSSKNKIRYLYFGLAITKLSFLIFLGRRAGLLGIFLSFSFLLLLTKNKLLKRIVFVILLIIFLIIGIFLSIPQGREVMIKSRDNLSLLLSLNYEKWAQAGSMGMRLYIWPIYFKKSLEEPFSGTGLGRRVQKRVLAETNKKALSLEHAHLLFLNIALQAGWHTALVFLIFYLWTFKRAYRLWKLSKEDPVMASLFLFLIAFFIMALFEGMEEGTRFTPFWIVSGLIWGYSKKYEEEYEEKSSLSS